MKTFVQAFFALLAAGSLSAGAENIKTVDGKEYKKTTNTRAEPDGLMITFSGGIVKIPFPELPQELRDRYHFDPKAAAQFRQQIETNDADLALQVEAVKENQRQFNL